MRQSLPRGRCFIYSMRAGWIIRGPREAHLRADNNYGPQEWKKLCRHCKIKNCYKFQYSKNIFLHYKYYLSLIPQNKIQTITIFDWLKWSLHKTLQKNNHFVIFFFVYFRIKLINFYYIQNMVYYRTGHN